MRESSQPPPPEPLPLTGRHHDAENDSESGNVPRAFSGTYQRRNAAADIAKAMSARFRQTASGAKARVLVDGFRRQTRTPA
jgi:hypothetical protein